MNILGWDWIILTVVAELMLLAILLFNLLKKKVRMIEGDTQENRNPVHKEKDEF